MQEDFRWFAKYPYDPRATDILKTISLNIEEFEKEDLRFLVEEAANRVVNLLKGERMLLWDNDYQELIKFYLSLLILRGTGNEYIYRAYSDAESKRAYRLLINEEDEKVLELSRSFNVDVFRIKNSFYIKYVDFINYTRGLSPIHWKLFNFKMERGYVKLSKRQISRILSNIIKRRVYQMIKSVEVTPDFILKYSDKVGDSVDIKEYREDVSDRNIDNYPPCIRKMIHDIPVGLSHPARFTLVTFLHKMGYSVGEIVDMFRTVPDFNLEKTTYQVEHILGLRGSRIEYEVPSCRKIRSYGMCFPDELCKYIRHPLSYVRRKRRRNETKR